MLNSAALIASACLLAGSPELIQPEIIETRAVELTQTVTLAGIPNGTKQVRLWVPIPSDNSWQRVLDRTVVSAPGSWKIVRQAEGRGDFVAVDLKSPPAGDAT